MLPLLGEDKKWSEKYFVKKLQTAIEEIERRLAPSLDLLPFPCFGPFSFIAERSSERPYHYLSTWKIGPLLSGLVLPYRQNIYLKDDSHSVYVV